MPPLPTFTLPLPPNGPPSGYNRSMWVRSSSSAFDTGLDNRDRFLGERRCVICGSGFGLKRCHIILQAEKAIWTNLQDRNWISSRIELPGHDPRNGLTLCTTHHTAFEEYYFFIRFMPDTRMFVFVNYSGRPDLGQFHGTVIAIDSDEKNAPFPSVFIIHEMRVRAFHPFQPIQLDLPDCLYFADWVDSEGLWDYEKDGFKRQKPPLEEGRPRKKQEQSDVQVATGASSRNLELNPNVVTDILAATRVMPSWQAWP